MQTTMVHLSNGGVGKTTTAILYARYLRTLNKRVSFVNIDNQGDSSKVLTTVDSDVHEQYYANTIGTILDFTSPRRVAHSFVPGVEDQVADFAEPAGSQRLQLVVEQGRSAANLRRRKALDHELAQHRLGLTSGDALHIHLGDRQHDCAHRTTSSLDRLREEVLAVVTGRRGGRLPALDEMHGSFERHIRGVNSRCVGAPPTYPEPWPHR